MFFLINVICCKRANPEKGMLGLFLVNWFGRDQSSKTVQTLDIHTPHHSVINAPRTPP